MERIKSNSFLKFLMLILACYRLANLISEDDGPGDVFRKLRQWTDGKRKEEQIKLFSQKSYADWADIDEKFYQEIIRGKWANLDDGIRCPYCVGVWAAGLLAVLVYTGIGDFLLLVLAIAGGQSVLQNMRKE